MAKTNITQYSSTPSSNTDINNINIDENCPASGLNNAIRELMAHLKNVDTGSQALTALSVTGDLTVDTSTLHVDSANNRVGVLTVSPSAHLQVNGSLGNNTAIFTDRNGTSAVTINQYGNVTFANDVIASTLATDSTGTDMIFKQGASESMRLDSGNLLINTTSTSIADDGFRYSASSGWLGVTRNAGQCLYLNRRTSDGNILDFRKDNSTVGSIGNNTGQSYFYIVNDGGCGIAFGNANAFPANGTGALSDNTKDLGGGATRWDDVFATNGTIQTSDRNEKQDIEELSDAEQRVAVVAKGLMRKFRWIDSVAEKGDNARTHFGIIAQDLQDAFTAEGLDASDYAMFTSNTWWEKEISVDAVEADEENGIEAQDAYTYKKIAEEATEGYTEKTRLGVRYNQLLAFIISAL